MSSEQNNSTSFPPTEPKLCDNGCGFSGTSNMNLCSKCYRSLRAEEDQTAVGKAAVKNSLKLPSCSLIITPEQKQPLETKPASVVVTAESSSTPIATGQEEAEHEDIDFICTGRVAHVDMAKWGCYVTCSKCGKKLQRTVSAFACL